VKTQPATHVIGCARRPTQSALTALCALVALLGTLAFPPSNAVAAASTLERVRKAGLVTCGVDATPGFSSIDTVGNPVGFDVDFCRAIAAAVLGDSNAIETRRVSTASKFEALVRGEIDVAFGMTTMTLSRDTTLGTVFPAVIFYDGQGFMTWADSGISTKNDLQGQTICVQQGTTSAGNLAEFLAREQITARIIDAPNSQEKINAFAQRRCSIVTGDRSELAVQAATLEPGKGQWPILPLVISSEPLGPVVATDDWQWFSIVRWVVNSTIAAESLGLNQSNTPTLTAPTNGERARLLGQDPAFGQGLGLDPQWARRVIIQVGAYDEIFTRNLSVLGLHRDTNALARDGGLLSPLPLR
jgi:general L-amino acid transport system substrate-binding protein